MKSQIGKVGAPLKGLLECPLRKGFIEFEFSSGDLISDLKAKAQDVWGAPKSGMDKILRTHGYFWDADAWAIFCQTGDGTFVHLRDSDQIPSAPPASAGYLDEGIMNQVAKRYRRVNWNGLVHESDMRRKAHLKLVFEREYEILNEEDYDVRLVALVAITGG